MSWGVNVCERVSLSSPSSYDRFLIGTVVALWLGIVATLPIDQSLTLGLFRYFVIHSIVKYQRYLENSYFQVNLS